MVTTQCSTAVPTPPSPPSPLGDQVLPQPHITDEDTEPKGQTHKGSHSESLTEPRPDASEGKEGSL